MNPLILTIIIALGTFILAILGASWLNQQAMNKRIDDLKMCLDARFDTIRAETGTARAEVGDLSQRVDRIDRQREALFKPIPTRGGD
jgi:hypothetical protein